ncbi:uncharacterized protein [Dysidea avara]|uniref:uncharacterized protein n=1 Tax=Dysidea avara TaxID=196820 RepID=UPI0033299A4F
MFLLAFNPLLKLAESLNHPHGYHIKIPIEDSEALPPVDSYVYVKWTEAGEEPPGWYKARVGQYFLDRSCKIVYDDSDDQVVSEVVALHTIEWKPCAKRARNFVSLDGKPAFTKANGKPSVKFADSMEHSLKGYADDVTLISCDIDVHKSVLQTIDLKAADLDLTFKPSKCISFLFDGSKVAPRGLPLSKGTTRPITEGQTKFLGKLIDVSLSATKKAAGKRMISHLTDLLSASDSLPIRGEYKLWIYRNYILSLTRFHLCVDAVSRGTISKLESIATRFLKKWLNLPQSATRVILYYPGVCCPSISHVSREAKLSLLACVSASSDLRLQELNLHLRLGNVALQIQDNDYSILSIAQKQLSAFPISSSLTVQSKFESSAELESSCKTWNRLLKGFHPGQLSFLLRAASDTLPTAVNLQRWSILCEAKCLLCDSRRPTTAHVLSSCPAALNQQRYTYRHDQVLRVLATKLSEAFADIPFVKVFADIPNFHADNSPQSTIPMSLLITSYRPDIVIYNSQSSSITLLELTCPLDSIHHIQSARNRKQSKTEYLQLLAEFDRLNIANYYDTIEITVLGHFQVSSIKNLSSLLNFV